MSTIGPDISDGTALVFTWLADKVLGGVKRALSWGWDKVKWAEAQDRYDQEIIRQYGQVRIFGQTEPKSLQDIFTDVYVLNTPSAYYHFSAEKLVDHLQNENRGVSYRDGERQPGESLLNQGSKFFILGKPGVGKTTFLKRLAVREAQRGKWGTCLGKVPIFVSLREYAKTNKPLQAFIIDQFAICHFPSAAPFVDALLKSGRAIVLFDGLDEVPVAGEEGNRRNQVAEDIARFARIYSNCHIVITCRVAATGFAFDPSFTCLEMSDFAPEQVEHFVTCWYWDENQPDHSSEFAEQMLSELALLKHKGIRDLTRNPLLLALLCMIYAETLSFPSCRAEIYEEALNALLKKWDSSRNIQRGGLYRTLSLGRKQQMFARIAYDAFARGDILFQQPDLEAHLKDYLQRVPELPESIDLDVEAVLQEIVAQHGIFALQSDGRYSFAHLTFQEYYTAKHISDNATSGTLDILFKHITDDKWREVFLLTASLLSDGTTFLSGFENALQQLLMQHPQLARLLQQIADQANESMSGYHTSAIRALVLARDLDLNLALAHVPARALARAHAFARDLDLDLAHTLARDLTHTLARGFARALALALDRDLDRDLARAIALDLALDSTLDLDLDLDRDFNLARDFNRDSDFDLNLARDLDLARDLNCDFARDLDLARDLDHDLAFARALALERTLDIDTDPKELISDIDLDLKKLSSDPDLKELISDIDLKELEELISDPDLKKLSSDLDLKELISKILRNCESQGQVDLYIEISVLEIPPDDAPAEVWQRFADDLEQIVREQEALKHFGQLHAEAEELADELRGKMSLSDEDWGALDAYVRATRLFYDCLQLAYTPDRKAFEDRIFLPPSQPKENL
jgi:hypothetical protein